MKTGQPHNKSKLVLELTGLLIVVILCVIASIKLRDALGGVLGTLVFVVILGGLGFLVRRYIDHRVTRKS